MEFGNIEKFASRMDGMQGICCLELVHNRYTLYYTQGCQNAMQVQLKRIICLCTILSVLFPVKIYV